MYVGRSKGMTGAFDRSTTEQCSVKNIKHVGQSKAKPGAFDRSTRRAILIHRYSKLGFFLQGGRQEPGTPVDRPEAKLPGLKKIQTCQSPILKCFELKTLQTFLNLFI